MAGRAHSVPQERSKVLFELLRKCPRALKGAARAPAWCPRALEVAVQAAGRCPRAPLLSAPGAFGTLFQAHTRNQRGARATG